MKPVAAHRWPGGADVGLALLVLAAVATMIVPIPTWLLDVLLAANLSASVAIVLVVLYVPEAVALASFPTLLLLTTLARLALNVSTSRLILLQGDAGRVVRAFGEVVVRGNYVVGAVVFLLLTVVQYVVVARGSERVAEVGARFVLDALPGKQIAIDAELRAGQLEPSEARARREALGRESHFYGAMDGAMKFVKGDVVASIVVLAVNLLGGLAIGVLQRGMDPSAALRRYGLLTIGDGLVTQLPALLLAVAAGVLVTRSSNEDGATPLGQELARQLLADPRALAAAGAFVAALGLVPGLPAVPFLAMGAALYATARARRARIAAAALHEVDRTSTRGAGGRFVPRVEPWSLALPPDLASALPALRDAAAAARTELFAELGVPLPAARVWVDPGVPPGHVAIALHEVPARIVAPPRELAPAELAPWAIREALPLLVARAGDFVGLAETQALLDELEAIAPAAVRAVVPRPVPLARLAEVLRRLVEEGVSVRDLPGVLEALAGAPDEKDPLALVELVRAHLRRAITFRATRGEPSLAVVLLDPMIEDTVRRGITRTAQGAYLALAPQPARDLLAAVKRAVAEARPAPPVVLTQPDVRRYVRKLLEAELPRVPVLSYAELLPEVVIRPAATATLVGIGD